MVMKPGDQISCDPDGTAVVAYADNSSFTIRHTTLLSVSSFFAEGGVVRLEILLKMGEVAAKVNKSEATKSDLQIKSPTATASVRGTIFSVVLRPACRRSPLTSVTRGVVEVDPAKARARDRERARPARRSRSRERDQPGCTARQGRRCRRDRHRRRPATS